MSYVPLARKYRPQSFQDLVGQNETSQALANSIKIRRIPSGIIFSGIRGVGKTTLARLYSKALNCEGEPSAAPCNQCSSCHSITTGAHEDVLEIDGASHNGVDEIRSLQETITFVPQRSPYKIYIIDEVHMLSASAFNALLKTLEEPPPQVLFIFATTELHKIPPTVLGRCQTYHLKKISPLDLKARLQWVLQEEKIPYEDKALDIIVQQGSGSLRDCLSFLDQGIALGEGQVTYKEICAMTSSLSSTPLLNLIKHLLDREPKECFSIIQEVDELGIDYIKLANQLITYIRHCFVLKELSLDHPAIRTLDLEEKEQRALKEVATSSPLLDLNRLFRSFIQCAKELDGSQLDRFVFENYCFEWCLDPGLPHVDELMSQVGRAPSNPKKQYQATPRPEKAPGPRAPLMKSFSQELQSKTQLPPRPELLKSSVAPAQAQTKLALEGSIVPPQPKQPERVKTTKELHKKFPDSWSQLVELWKKARPLQGRKLEEVHPLQYSPEKITVAVSSTGIIGPTLLQKDTQKRITDQFRELFDFSGEFSAVLKESIEPKEQSQPAKATLPNLDAPEKPKLPPSLLEVKAKENQEKHRQAKDEIYNHPLTQSVLKEFQGKVISDQINI